MKNYNFIVFIDDDPASNYYHEYILRDCDLVGETASFISPQTALKYFQEIAQGAEHKMPDLLFVDINMPQMNGFEFVEAFSQLSFLDPPRIIVISTSINPNDKQRCISDPNISEFLNKPLTVEYLEQLKTEMVQQQNF